MGILLAFVAIIFGIILICAGIMKLAEKLDDYPCLSVFCVVIMFFIVFFGFGSLGYLVKQKRIKEAEKFEDWYYEEKLVEDKDSLSLWEYDFWIDYDKEKVYIKKYRR